MTTEEVTALSAFIMDFDPRYEACRPISGESESIRALPADGNAVTYYSLTDYAEDAARNVDSGEFKTRLERWLSEQQSGE